MSQKKRPKDPRGGHVRIYWEIVDSHAYQALSFSAQSLYVAMRRQLLATNNGNISATLGTLKRSGWRSSATLIKGLRELEGVGLIAKTRQGGVAYMSKICSLYRFTDEACYEFPKLEIPACKATFDYRDLKTRAEAKQAIACSSERRKGKKPKVQNLIGTASKAEAISSFSDSIPELVTNHSIQ